MECRILGKTGLKVSTVGVGCWQMGGLAGADSGWTGTTDEESIATIHRARELGINLLDTAEGYGQGHSEEIIGEATQGIRDDFVIATKVRPVTDDPDEVTFNKVPVFSYFDGRLSCRFNGKTILDGQSKAGAPLQGLALDAVNKVNELAMDPELRLDLAFQEGDIQILNNYLILHARGGFEDHLEPERRRNLLRLWINLHHGRKLAPEFANRLNTGPRGGVMIRPDAPEGIRP